MALLIFALIVLIIAGLLVFAVDSIPLGAPYNVVAKVLILIIAALAIAQRAGLV